MRRYSLKTLLLTCFVVALLLSNFGLVAKNWKLQREVTQLRTETGHLVPVERDRVNVIAVPQSEENFWQWRIYAPEDVEFDAGIAIGDIPDDGVGSHQATTTGLQLPSVENGVVVSLSVSRDINDEYVLKLRYPGGALAQRTRKDPKNWLEGSGAHRTAAGDGVEAYAYDEPIALRRVRLMDPVSGTLKSGTTAPGYMVWLTPRQKSPSPRH